MTLYIYLSFLLRFRDRFPALLFDNIQAWAGPGCARFDRLEQAAGKLVICYRREIEFVAFLLNFMFAFKRSPEDQPFSNIFFKTGNGSSTKTTNKV